MKKLLKKKSVLLNELKQRTQDAKKKLQGVKVGSSVMPGDNSSVQHEGPSQTANTSIDNQDIKKDDLVAANDNHDKSSSPNDEVPQEPLQTTTLDDHMNSLPNAEPSTTKILDSDANKQASSDLPKSSTSMDPTSNQDSNSANQTDPLTTNSDTKEATNQSTETGQQPNNGSSTSQISDLDANKQPNTVATDDSPKSSTAMAPTSNQDSNVVDQTNPPTADNETKQPTNQSTKTASTDSDTNKQAKAVATDESPKSSTTMVPNQDPNLVDQTNPPKKDDDTKKATNQSTETDSTDQQTDKKKSSSDADQLRTLVHQEITLVKKICPKLGEHGKTINEEADRVNERYNKLIEEPHGIKELKTLKRTVTKLKLQIPARYITYDDTEKQKKQLSVESSDDISTKLQKNMPRLHNELFHKSYVCNTIHLRYNELRPEWIKPCLLCFTVFPENATISRRSMIYWWIGEGLIPGEDDTAEENANGIFNELIELGFIEAVSKRSRRYVANCKMNPMVRAALVMIADEEKSFDFDEYGKPKDFGKFDEIESPEDMPSICPLGEPKDFFHFYDEKRKEITETIEIDDSCQFVALPSDGEELVNRNGEKIDETKKYYFYERKKITTKSCKVCLMGSGLSKGIPWEKLHTLFNVQEVILEFKPEWFLQMKNLNVLFLGKWQSSATHHIEVEEDEFFKSFDYMNNVRFFNLQGVSRISVLPDSISKLKSLLVLDLRSCHNLEEIPKTIGELKCLTHLDMSECYLLRKIPKEISSLKSLQVLKGFVVVEILGKDMCTLHDLRRLENLRKLGMYTHMKNFPEEKHLESLQKLETLRKLTILWGGHESMTTNTEKQGNGDHKKNDLQPKVMGFITKKQWVQGNMRRMNAFNNSTLGMRLEKLDLKCFPHSVTPHWLTAYNLQGLKKLYIRGGQFSDLGQYQEMFESDDSLPKETWNVEILRLKYLEELNLEWRELHSLFPKLKSLEKVKCPRLSLFPCNEKGVWMKKGFSTT